MDVPVFNKGFHLYHIKLNVTPIEYETVIMKYTWHKLKGIPFNKNIGYIFKLIYHTKPLYSSDTLIPLYIINICVAYSQIDTDDYHDLSRHVWNIDKEGYAYFDNPITNNRIYIS